MGQFSVEITRLPGSVPSGNQQVDHRTLEAQRAEALELAAEARERGDEIEELAQTVRAIELDREPLPQLSLGAWQLKERGIEVAAVRVWQEVKERALEVGRVAQELATHAREWLGRVAERALEALEPAPDAWGEFFAEAAGGGLRDDLSRDLDRERQALDQTERVRQQEVVKERETHARRDNELDHGL